MRDVTPRRAHLTGGFANNENFLNCVTPNDGTQRYLVSEPVVWMSHFLLITHIGFRAVNGKMILLWDLRAEAVPRRAERPKDVGFTCFLLGAAKSGIEKKGGEEEQKNKHEMINTTQFSVSATPESERDVAGGRAVPERVTFTPLLLKRGCCGSMPWAHMCVCVCPKKLQRDTSSRLVSSRPPPPARNKRDL